MSLRRKGSGVLEEEARDGVWTAAKDMLMNGVSVKGTMLADKMECAEGGRGADSIA